MHLLKAEDVQKILEIGDQAVHSPLIACRSRGGTPMASQKGSDNPQMAGESGNPAVIQLFRLETSMYKQDGIRILPGVSKIIQPVDYLQGFVNFYCGHGSSCFAL
jgi:hypothetical protein